ncbi:MAG: alpha/beta fold hydrolase [Halanaeroarchaeum sp.]
MAGIFDVEPVAGRYVWLEVQGESYRTYFESAGSGDVSLVLLHTAGADARQYRHLLNDPYVLDRFTVYAFDMPWHGKSFPPLDSEWWTADYELTTDFYTSLVMQFIDALGLDRPAVLGCSMGAPSSWNSRTPMPSPFAPSWASNRPPSPPHATSAIWTTRP